MPTYLFRTVCRFSVVDKRTECPSHVFPRILRAVRHYPAIFSILTCVVFHIQDEAGYVIREEISNIRHGCTWSGQCFTHGGKAAIRLLSWFVKGSSTVLLSVHRKCFGAILGPMELRRCSKEELVILCENSEIWDCHGEYLIIGWGWHLNCSRLEVNIE